MAEILVTSATLRAKAEELRNANEQFKGKVSNLESKEANLGTMWEGEAKNAFHLAFNKDKVQMDNFYTLMTQYINALLDIAAEYDKAEALNVNTGNTRTY